MERHRKPRQLLFQLLQWQVSKAKPGSVTASDPPRTSKLALSKQHRGHDKITHKIINDCIYFLCLPQIILWRSETKARQCSVGVSLLRLIPQLQHRTHQLGNSWTEEENNTAGFPFLAWHLGALVTGTALLGCVTSWDSTSWGSTFQRCCIKRNSLWNVCVSMSVLAMNY